jgi:hypothetical protein
LPVLTQTALNIVALVSTLQTGKQLNPEEAAGDPENFGGSEQGPETLLQSLVQRVQSESESRHTAQN